jgi:uncharacterized protein YutE (UPF0331/DUF86 family)
MIDPVITRKLASLQQVLQELRSLGALEGESLGADWKTRRIVERDLQIAIEIVIDVCHRLLSCRGQIPSASGREAIERCQSLGILGTDVAYGALVSFCNLVVHQYDDVDPSILAHVVNQRLVDFDRFLEEVLSSHAG